MGSRNDLEAQGLRDKVGAKGKCKNDGSTSNNSQGDDLGLSGFRYLLILFINFSHKSEGEKAYQYSVSWFLLYVIFGCAVNTTLLWFLGERDDLYRQLWHACAGPLVNVPSVGDKVFYFPQGHIEQVEAYTSQEGTVEMPVYDIPSKIPCKVVYAQLQAEAHTDEVYAQITLLPEFITDSDRKGLCIISGFCEDGTYLIQLTSSFFPSGHVSRTTCTGTGGKGLAWFRMAISSHISGGSVNLLPWQPRRHLLTSGWSSFVGAKKLVAGDACIFLRGENGELFVGVHRATKPQASTSASVLSGHSMQHGILASAFHAMTTGTMFTVYYRPWTSPVEFIIPHDQYMKSAEIDFSIGTRFRMQFEGEEYPEPTPSRIAGTVVGIDNIDPIRWDDSEWRCLEVEWDVLSMTSARPQRVSPWSIEPTVVKKKKLASLFPNRKRARPLDQSTPGFSVFVGNGFLKSPANCAQKRQLGVLQGQESRAMGAFQLGASGQQLLLPQPNPVRMRDPFSHPHGSTISIPGGNPPHPMIANYQPPTFTSCGAHNCSEASGSLSFPKVSLTSSASQECTAPEEKGEIGAPMGQPNGKCMLFGVNISSSPMALPSNQMLSSRELCSPCPSQVSEPSKGISGNNPYKQCRNCCPSANRSCTKVLKYGTTLGRSVDLARFDGYGGLIRKLDQMFEFKGTLIDGNSGWCVTYMDGEGDMMLIGDYPWLLRNSGTWYARCLSVQRKMLISWIWAHRIRHHLKFYLLLMVTEITYTVYVYM
ncbi:hypothetical protein RHSIM_Rhsim01G0279900 [Rhododendron simsii]|uniref:Auxin response factor n=1 Tax=Rhododendron simsii TaxID=118357 RepID=A0A834HJR8_RHOSS|nr:hypothetical protein RHSIM_Rhsim01G0279900 [Rhododendron simsii]